MTYKIKLKRGTASNWASVNPILLDGEPGVEIDDNKLKIGNGVDAWNDLPYIAADPADLSGYALLDSPDFTGTPTAPTPASSDNSDKLATTEYVTTAIDAIPSGGGGTGEGSPHEIQEVIGSGLGGTASIFNLMASTPFTVNEDCDVSAVAIQVPATTALVAGTLVGIATDWNGSGTIPWLAHGTVVALSGPGRQVVVLASTVSLVPGTTYRIVSTDTHVSVGAPPYVPVGVVATIPTSTYVGTTFNTLRTDHAILFDLIGPVTVFTEDTGGANGSVVSQAWDIDTDGAQTKRLTWLVEGEVQLSKNGLLQRIARDFFVADHSLYLLDELDIADGDDIEVWYNRSSKAPDLEAQSGQVTILDDSLHNAFPGFCVARNGDYVVSWRSATAHATGVGSIKLGRSTDRGATWSISTIYTGTDDFRDPVVSQTRAGMFIVGFDYTGSIFPGLRVFKSTDEGYTWTQVAHITGGAIYTASNYASSAPIIDGPNGELLWPTYGTDTGDTLGRVKILVSVDGGVTWTQRATLYSGAIEYVEPNMCLLDDGRLLLLIRSDTTTNIYQSHSADGGATWTTPVVGIPSASGKPACMQLYGRVHVMYRQGGGGPLGYAYSDDGGTTFTSEGNVFGGPNNYAYGAWADTGGAVPSAVYCNETSIFSNSDIFFRRVPVLLS